MERDVEVVKDAQLLEDALKALWDKARSISELVSQLREEKKSDHGRERVLQQEVESLRSLLANKEQELKRLKAEHAQLVNSNGNNMLSVEEKDNLKNKIRDLIAKINSHL